jgi:hypothetical protein
MAVVIMILMAIFGIFNLLIQDQDASFTYYLNEMVFLGAIYTSMVFKDWSYKARSVSLLILPATALEKILLVMFYTVVVFIPLFTIVYFASLFGILKILNKDSLFVFFDQYHGLSPITALLLYAILPYVFVQSLILLCTVWFKKMQFLIAFALYAILIGGSFFLNPYYIERLLSFGGIRPEIIKQLVFFPLDISYWGGNKKMLTQMVTRSDLITLISAIVLMISTILFYMASYFKLKEKEV